MPHNGSYDPIGRWAPWHHRKDGGWWLLMLTIFAGTCWFMTLAGGYWE